MDNPTMNGKLYKPYTIYVPWKCTEMYNPTADDGFSATNCNNNTNTLRETRARETQTFNPAGEHTNGARSTRTNAWKEQHIKDGQTKKRVSEVYKFKIPQRRRPSIRQLTTQTNRGQWKCTVRLSTMRIERERKRTQRTRLLFELGGPIRPVRGMRNWV